MSIQNAKDYYNRIATDKNFREQLEQLSTDEERRKNAIEAGYEFTDEEWSQAIKQMREEVASNEELSEEELESVVGGKFQPTIAMMYGAPSPYGDWWTNYFFKK